MTVLDSTIPTPDSGDGSIGIFNINIGGTGGLGLSPFTEMARRDGLPFPVVNAQIDTDPNTFTTLTCDVPILLNVNQEIVEMLQGNAELFGPRVVNILQKEARMLAAGDIRNGMRTTRCLSQLVFSYYRDALAERLRDGCDRLNDMGATHIIPVLSFSTGGGTGSAFSVLLLDAFSDPSFVSALVLGNSPSMIAPPLMFAVEPYAYARRHTVIQRTKIMANSYAFRLETDYVLRREMDPARVQYIFHIGFSNNSGVCLNTTDQIGQVLGHSMYTIERNYAALKARWVDGPDAAADGDHPHVLNSMSRSDFRTKPR